MKPPAAPSPLMASAHIVVVTTTSVGAAGPVRRFYAVNLPSQEEAVTAVRKRLRTGETASWIDVRSLTIGPGEVREI